MMQEFLGLVSERLLDVWVSLKIINIRNCQWDLWKMNIGEERLTIF